MQGVLSVLGVLAGLVLGFWGGFRLGERIRRAHNPRRTWWMAAVAAWVGGLAITFAGQVAGNLPVAVFGVSLAAGAITGLKYGGAEFAHVFRGQADGDADADPASRRDGSGAPGDRRG